MGDEVLDFIYNACWELSMIKNLKITHFGIFDNFYNPNLSFKKFNLFFGWNYSGKTTLSKIFASFDIKKLPQNYDNISFELLGEKGNYGINDLEQIIKNI